MMLFTLSATAIQSSYMYIPPLTARTCPVIYAASSDARKHDRRRHIVDAARAGRAESAPPSRPAPSRRSARVMSVSIMPGRDDVHRDAARRHFARQRLGEADQPGLRRGVVGLPGVAHLPDHRADRDDPAAALLQHRPHRRLRQHERGGEVGGHHRVPVLALHAHQQLIARDAGVADDDVEPAVRVDDAARAAVSSAAASVTSTLSASAVGRRAVSVGHAVVRRDRRARRPPRSRPARRAARQSRGRCRATRRSRARLCR